MLAKQPPILPHKKYVYKVIYEYVSPKHFILLMKL